MAKAFYNLEDLHSIPILDVCEAFGILVERKGRSYFCKLRDEKTASCKLYLDGKNGYDSFYDFGSCRGGSVINFVEEWVGCDWQSAVEELARVFHVEPINNTDYFNRNELTDLEYKKIGVYADVATKNFDFDVEKYSLESVKKFSEKYAMPVNQLRKDYPNMYTHEVMRKRAIPFVYSLRNQYYLSLYSCLSLQKAVTGHFDINNISEDDIKEYSNLSKKLIQAETLLKKALRGTDIKYSCRDYDVRVDLKQLYYGEISFEVGPKFYADLKKEQNRLGVDFLPKPKQVSFNDYISLNEYGINEVFHAAFLKNDEVNIVFLPDDEHLIDKCIGLYNKAQELEEAEKTEVEKSSFDKQPNVTLGER